MDHDRRNANRPATRCAIGIATVAVSLSNASPPDRYTLDCEGATSKAGKRPFRSLAGRSARVLTPMDALPGRCAQAGAKLGSITYGLGSTRGPGYRSAGRYWRGWIA